MPLHCGSQTSFRERKTSPSGGGRQHLDRAFTWASLGTTGGQRFQAGMGSGDTDRYGCAYCRPTLACKCPARFGSKVRNAIPSKENNPPVDPIQSTPSRVCARAFMSCGAPSRPSHEVCSICQSLWSCADSGQHIAQRAASSNIARLTPEPLSLFWVLRSFIGVNNRWVAA